MVQNLWCVLCWFTWSFGSNMTFLTPVCQLQQPLNFFNVSMLQRSKLSHLLEGTGKQNWMKEIGCQNLCPSLTCSVMRGWHWGLKEGWEKNEAQRKMLKTQLLCYLNIAACFWIWTCCSIDFKSKSTAKDKVAKRIKSAMIARKNQNKTEKKHVKTMGSPKTMSRVGQSLIHQMSCNMQVAPMLTKTNFLRRRTKEASWQGLDCAKTS